MQGNGPYHPYRTQRNLALSTQHLPHVHHVITTVIYNIHITPPNALQQSWGQLLMVFVRAVWAPGDSRTGQTYPNHDFQI